MSDDDLVNKGVIVNRPAGTTASGARTFIVTGLHRSGTSLIASILQQAGVFMGRQISDAVFEDEEMVATLHAGDLGALRHLIADRNANYGTWGFKVPVIYTHLRPEQLPLFDNPHLIVPFRDIVSISVRKSLSEYKDTMHALREAVGQLDAMVTFLDSASAPSLLLSYEKAVLFRANFVDALMRFCGLPDNAALRGRLIDLIEPNRRHYIGHARQTFRGILEGVVDDWIHGWCQLIGDLAPVLLEVHIDGRVVTSMPADMFRQDLADAGIGEGRHGFRVDLRPFGPPPDAVIKIKVARWSDELENSGRRLAQYRARTA
jgi:hypothetical protein